MQHSRIFTWWKEGDKLPEGFSVSLMCSGEIWNLPSYGVNVCVLPKFIHWTLFPWGYIRKLSGLGEVIKVRLGHESGALVMGLETL